MNVGHLHSIRHCAAESVQRVLLQQASYEIPRLLWQGVSVTVLWPVKVALDDVLEQLLGCLTVEGHNATQELVHDYAQ